MEALPSRAPLWRSGPDAPCSEKERVSSVYSLHGWSAVCLENKQRSSLMSVGKVNRDVDNYITGRGKGGGQ